MKTRTTFQAPTIRRRPPSVNLRYAAYLILASSIAASVYALATSAAEGLLM